MNHAILRVGITALHTRKDVDYFIHSLQEICESL
jgi:selenocysteine lyase/cysteine desulfurase